jgi:hypothetical protein
MHTHHLGPWYVLAGMGNILLDAESLFMWINKFKSSIMLSESVGRRDINIFGEVCIFLLYQPLLHIYFIGTHPLPFLVSPGLLITRSQRKAVINRCWRD